ncbi:MAG TPA: periplasmic heavy metal sensor [Vicinamibacterales bacterium]|jgi:Spy/CpxP family protein refolding chaperone
MKSRWRAWAIAAGLLLMLSPVAQGQSFGFPWWRDPQFQRDLSLTTEQSSKIDAVFQQTIPTLREKKTQLDAQEEELSKMIAANADEASVTRQVDKVESIRANMNKMRTLMLLHMRQVLSPDQRVKLNKLHDQWEKDHRRERGR